MTQRQKVQVQLNKGGVNNFWAIQNNILRLGAVIFELRQNLTDAFVIDGCFGSELKGRTEEFKKKNRRNYFYFLKRA
jgi:hypothetical protein